MSDANVTAEELEAAKYRKHDLDNKSFIDGLKKIIKTRTIRVNTYIDKEVSDGYMLKVQVEKFTTANKQSGRRGGISMGSRWIKGYLTEAVNKELMNMLDAIPRKSYIDTRDGTSRERPLKIVKIYEEALTDLDLATLWDTKEK